MRISASMAQRPWASQGSTGNLIAFNSTNFAENGLAVINAWNNTVKCNYFNGGGVDEEPNHSYAQVGENTYTLNYTTGGGVIDRRQQHRAIRRGRASARRDFVTKNVFIGPGPIYCECNADGSARCGQQELRRHVVGQPHLGRVVQVRWRERQHLRTVRQQGPCPAGDEDGRGYPNPIAKARPSCRHPVAQGKKSGRTSGEGTRCRRRGGRTCGNDFARPDHRRGRR